MKKTFIMLVIASISLLSANGQQAKWDEMEAFHQVISKTFHPAEENKLQPARDSVQALLKAARTWQQSKVPAGYKTEVVKPILEKLVNECSILEKMVKQKQNDAALKKRITKVHDVFHEIMEKCRK